jgi:hypothetical protein
MTLDLFQGWGIAFSPYVGWPLLAALGGLGLVICAIAFWRRLRGAGWRAGLLALLLALLANPGLIKQERQPIRDVAVAVVDTSPSQQVGARSARSERALASLQRQAEPIGDLDLRVIRAPAGGDAVLADKTQLFGPLMEAFADVPPARRAGAIIISDGQIHDVPAPGGLPRIGPVHLLLTGDHDEVDRRLTIVRAPSFALVGKPAEFTIRVDDQAPQDKGPARVVVRQDGQVVDTLEVQPGVEQTLSYTLSHAGSTAFEIEADALPGELTEANNRAAVVVNGVRDRLRVLLVSGEPHPGERTWRSLLKSDPAVDLVHFTILRPPEKNDGTPIRELSLIAFPILELFEVKLDEFDLVIFDRYRRRGVLPGVYLENIARYVRNGGALLVSSGPSFAGPFSLYGTELGAVLPAGPTGRMLEGPFKPEVTELGARHPVTETLQPPGTDRATPAWGHWFRQVEAEVHSGSVVMQGKDGKPLVVLDHVGEGRVAQVLSDQLWLWARGYDGGGPQAELLRRLAHWLMKEPELEEEALRASVEGRRISIERQSMKPATDLVEVTAPSGQKSSLQLELGPDGLARGTLMADEAGLWQFVDNRDGTERRAVAVVGSVNPPERADLRTTSELMAPVLSATGGGVLWLADTPEPELRRPGPHQSQAGRNWIGLTANGDYVVTGSSRRPALPLAPALIAALLLFAAAWRREAR